MHLSSYVSSGNSTDHVRHFYPISHYAFFTELYFQRGRISDQKLETELIIFVNKTYTSKCNLKLTKFVSYVVKSYITRLKVILGNNARIISNSKAALNGNIYKITKNVRAVVSESLLNILVTLTFIIQSSQNEFWWQNTELTSTIPNE